MDARPVFCASRSYGDASGFGGRRIRFVAREHGIDGSDRGGSDRSGYGRGADVTPWLLAKYFGLRSFSTLYAWTWTAYAIAGAIGPVMMGKAFDVTGSYAALLTRLAGLTACAAALMLFMPRYENAPVHGEPAKAAAA